MELYAQDDGDASWINPLGRVNCAFPLVVPFHGWGFTAVSGSSIGQKGMTFCARTLATTAADLLTQPKPHVVFRPTRARGALIRLDPKTQLLYAGERFFINGETFAVPKRHREAMRRLADRRRGEAASLAGQAKLIGEWRRAGYVHLEKRNG